MAEVPGVAQLAPQQPTIDHQAAPDPGRHDHRQEAVSYTHLTLPTSDLV